MCLHNLTDYGFLLYCGASAATSMKWIDAKMKELGVSSNSNYKICFHLDSLAMITVQTPKYGVIEVNRSKSSGCMLGFGVIHGYRF